MVASVGIAGDIVGAGGVFFIVILCGDPATLNQCAWIAGVWLLLDSVFAGVCVRLVSEFVLS